MSSSDEDDDSSYESTEERIGGMLHEAVLEVNEEIAIAQRPVSPPCTDAGHQNTATDDNGIESRRSALRAVFPPFFFPIRPGSATSTSSGGGSGGGLSCPVQSFHLNRRRTWGSAIAHRLVMELVVPATVFRAVVAVFHLWLERSGGDGDDCDDDSNDQSRSRYYGTSKPFNDKIASAPMEEIVSYLKFLSQECGVGDAVAERKHNVDVDDDTDIDLSAICHHFLPSLAEASRQSIAGKTIIRSMEDTVDPMALEIDLEACRSITLGEWKAFLGIPREHVPSADQLADGSSDFIALLEWWNSLPPLLGDTSAVVEVLDEQSLYNFLAEYCRAVDVSVMKYTCHGWTSAIGCVHRRRCGMMMTRLGHPASARTAFYNGAMGRLAVCDLIRTYGQMKLSVGFVRNSCHARNVPVIEEAECTDECDRSLSCSEKIKTCEDSASMKGDKEQKMKALNSEKLVDLFPSDDDDDISNEPKRIFRRIKRGIATTTPTRDGTAGAVRTSISNAEKRLRCQNENNPNYCEVSRAWADARDTFGVDLCSDDDDHESL